MSRLRAPLAIALLLACGLASCGEADRAATSASATSAKAPTAIANAEGSHITTTPEGIVYDGDDGPIRFFGQEAGASDRQALTALVSRYYAAAAKEDGAGACPLMAALTVETIPEDYGEEPELSGKTCATIMSKLFAQRHAELLRDSATLKVIDARVQGNRALLLLRFNGAAEPNHIAAHHEGSAWKIWELLATHMP